MAAGRGPSGAGPSGAAGGRQYGATYCCWWPYLNSSMVLRTVVLTQCHLAYFDQACDLRVCVTPADPASQRLRFLPAPVRAGQQHPRQACFPRSCGGGAEHAAGADPCQSRTGAARHQPAAGGFPVLRGGFPHAGDLQALSRGQLSPTRNASPRNPRTLPDAENLPIRTENPPGPARKPSTQREPSRQHPKTLPHTTTRPRTRPRAPLNRAIATQDQPKPSGIESGRRPDSSK